MARKYLDTTGLTALWAKITDKVTAVQAMLNSAVSTLSDAIAAKVSKSGDTMTGNLKFEGSSQPSVLFKESGYGDKFEIKPSFGGTDNANYLAIKTATGAAGTDPDTTEKIRIRPSGQVEFLSNVNLYGYDLKLLTPSSSSNDSSDIIYCYGNGAEKARIYVDNSPTDKTSGRLLVRAYKSDGTQIYSDRIPLLSDVTDRVAKGGDTMTGALIMSNVNANVTDTDVKVGTAPSSTIYGNGFYCQSNNGGDLFYVRATQDTSDNVGMQIEVRRAIGSTTYYNTLRLGISNTGDKTVNVSDPADWRSAIGHPFEWDINTNNTTDTWVPVLNNGKLQHRALHASLNSPQSVSFTRSHASVSYQEGLVCYRFGNVVTFAGYFSCGATIGANTTLYSGLPKPAGGKHIYFTWSGSDFYLHGSDGTVRTNSQIVSRTYVGTFTYVCA